MRNIWLFICLIVLAACGRPAADYPATIGALGAAATAEAGRTAELSATLALARADTRRLAATATALALVPTPTPVIVTIALSATLPLSATAAPAADRCGQPAPGAISYLDAKASAGTVATVQGRIVKVGQSKKALFLNFHEPYQGYFSGVIFASAWRQFEVGIAETYAGRCVRISGAVKLYKGSPEIVVSSPAQIEILEE
ncbi:MAG TPA: hypothetical protein VGE07_10715 [Herpetosiphonaceae bacterium]